MMRPFNRPLRAQLSLGLKTQFSKSSSQFWHWTIEPWQQISLNPVWHYSPIVLWVVLMAFNTSHEDNAVSRRRPVHRADSVLIVVANVLQEQRFECRAPRLGRLVRLRRPELARLLPQMVVPEKIQSRWNKFTIRNSSISTDVQQTNAKLPFKSKYNC